MNGQVDAAYATTVSGPTRKLEASPRGIFWPPAPHDDADCWAAINKVVPFFTPHMATRGAGISIAQPHEGATYPYPMLITLPEQSEQEVHDLAQVIHHHYDDFKNADPGAIGWALERQKLTWQVPYHAGAVRYLRSAGVWGEVQDAHNQRLIERQNLLARTWKTHVAGNEGSPDFINLWYAARADALISAGFDPVWLSPGAG